MVRLLSPAFVARVDEHVLVANGEVLRVVLAVAVPDERRNEVLLTEDRVHQEVQIRDLGVVDAHDDEAASRRLKTSRSMK